MDKEEIQKELNELDYVGDISDGYHTFDELYAHRQALFIALCAQMPSYCYKTRVNFEGESWPGWFILMMEHPTVGQISYHISDEYWDVVNVEERPKVSAFDGHTSPDVLDRLKDLFMAI